MHAREMRRVNLFFSHNGLMPDAREIIFRVFSFARLSAFFAPLCIPTLGQPSLTALFSFLLVPLTVFFLLFSFPLDFSTHRTHLPQNAATSTPPRLLASSVVSPSSRNRAPGPGLPPPSPLSPSPHSPPCPSPLSRRHPQNPRPTLCGSGWRWRAGARTT
ncbi:hypothetical protein B0H14DRAFT_3864039, partial [Mycena olivaceomarginata]